MLKSSLFFALGTVLSRSVGLLRESVIAASFGSGFLLDAFLVANRIPNLMRELVAEGALGSSFTKVFAQINSESDEKAARFYQVIFWLSSIAGLIISLCGIFFADKIVLLLINSSSQTQNALFLSTCTHLAQVLFPFIALMMLASIAQGALYGNNRYFISAASPIALSGGYILGATWMADLFELYLPTSLDTAFADRRILALATGVLLGGAASLWLQIRAVHRCITIKKIDLRKQFKAFIPDLKQLGLLMGPMILASSAGQVNVMVNTYFATGLGYGPVSWLSLSFRLVQLPIGVIAVGSAAVLLPKLSVAYKKKNSGHPEAKKLLADSTSQLLWLLLPCSLFFWVSSLEVVSLIYQYGAFSQQDSIETAFCLQAYSAGILGYGLVKTWTIPFYVSEKTKVAMSISMLGILVNYSLNSYFVDQFGARGLAYTASLLLSWQALMLASGMLYFKIPADWKSIFKHAWITLVCSVGGITLDGYTRTLFESLQLSNRSITTLCAKLLVSGISITLPFLLGAAFFLDLKQLKKPKTKQ